MAISRRVALVVCVLVCAAAAAATRAEAEQKWAAFLEARSELFKPWMDKVGAVAGPQAEELREVAAKRYAKAELAISLAFNELPMVRHVAREMLTRWVAMANEFFKGSATYWTDMANWMSFGRSGNNQDVLGCDGFRNCFLPKGLTKEEYAQKVVKYLADDTQWNTLNVREIVHFIGRFAEPGEEKLYNDATEQKAGERFVLLKAMDAVHQPKLKPFGLNVEHLKKEEVQCAKDGPEIKALLGKLKTQLSDADKEKVKKDLGSKPTFKKGLLSPLTQIMVDARKPGFRGPRQLSDEEKAARPMIKKETLFNNLKNFGLPPFSEGEKLWTEKLMQGGEAQRMGPPSLQWMKETIEHLGAVAAGPSGTTDELLQSYDYTSLTLDPFGGYAGRAMAGATMGPYFHHTLWEIQQGAQMDGRHGVTFDINKPFDSGVLTPKCQSNIPRTKITFDGDKPKFEVTKETLKDDSTTCTDFAKAVKKHFDKLTPEVATQWVEQMMYVPFAAHTHNLHKRLKHDGYDPNAAPGVQYKGGTKATEKNRLENNVPTLTATINTAICSNKGFNDEPHMKALIWPECANAAAPAAASAAAPSPRFKAHGLRQQSLKKQLRKARHNKQQ